MELTKLEKIECPRCYLIIDGLDIRIVPCDDGTWRCPRCATELEYGSDIGGESCTDIILRDDVDDPKIEREFNDLMMMMQNWANAYIKYMDRKRECDWSTPHEFFEEFFHQMCPYIDRLHKTGNSRPDLMKGIGNKLVEVMEQIVLKCEQEEDLMRLTGRWSDGEQEIKDYWHEKTKKLKAPPEILRLSQDTDS